MQRLGYLIDGHHVRCAQCLHSAFVDHDRRVLNSRIPVVLYTETIGAYRQTCHGCNAVLVEGKPGWPELFVDRVNTVKLWQVIVFGVTTKRDGLESTSGAPLFYVHAMHADAAWTVAKAIVSHGHNITQISGTVCIVRVLSNGFVETDGEGYKSFVEEFKDGQRE